MTVERVADHQLEQVKKTILFMAGCVERALDLVTSGLSAKSPSHFQQVHTIEEQVNQAHLKVDELCAQYLAIQQPVAKDLRLVVSLIKMNVDLERMGDQCVNIAHLGRELLERQGQDLAGLPDLLLIQEMGKSVKQMVRDALDSFVHEDVDKAKSVLLMDDEVDKKKAKVFKDFSDAIKVTPAIVESALDVIMMAKNLERLGDHATNIAEDVVYVSTGKDIRHGGR